MFHRSHSLEGRTRRQEASIGGGWGGGGAEQEWLLTIYRVAMVDVMGPDDQHLDMSLTSEHSGCSKFCMMSNNLE